MVSASIFCPDFPWLWMVAWRLLLVLIFIAATESPWPATNTLRSHSSGLFLKKTLDLSLCFRLGWYFPKTIWTHLLLSTLVILSGVLSHSRRLKNRVLTPEKSQEEVLVSRALSQAPLPTRLVHYCSVGQLRLDVTLNAEVVMSHRCLCWPHMEPLNIPLVSDLKLACLLVYYVKPEILDSSVEHRAHSW